MSLRMFILLSVLAVAMATNDDVTRLNNDAIPRDVFPDIGEYFYVGVPLNWTDALLACQAIDSHLLIINSNEERIAIKDMMIKYDVTFIHLGFGDQWTEGKYNDILGKPISSAFDLEYQWAAGNPKGNATYNCGGFSALGFQDTRCEDKNTFVCETIEPTAGEAPPGYTLIPTHGYYKYHSNETTWTDADETCRAEGSHLLVLNSQQELDALVAAFNMSYYFEFLLGVHRFYGGNTNWRTVGGELLNSTGYSRWFNDNSEPYGTYIAFPYTRFIGSSPSQQGIVATTPSHARHFVCEYDLFQCN